MVSILKLRRARVLRTIRLLGRLIDLSKRNGNNSDVGFYSDELDKQHARLSLIDSSLLKSKEVL